VSSNCRQRSKSWDEFTAPGAELAIAVGLSHHAERAVVFKCLAGRRSPYSSLGLHVPNATGQVRSARVTRERVSPQAALDRLDGLHAAMGLQTEMQL